MNPPDLIANRIVELLRPDLDNEVEKKQIKEKDDIRHGALYIIGKREKEE